LARLAETGVGPGWHCLEVGTGCGSVARWLADRVLPAGSVLATDLDPGWIVPRGSLSAQRHDIAADPIPTETYDLIHVRLVLRYLPDRHDVLDKLVRALKPGGILQIDEFDQDYSPLLLPPDTASAQRYERFLAAKERVFAAAGVASDWGRTAAAAMAAAGLIDVEPEPFLFRWQAGSPGAELLVFLTYALGEQLHGEGITSEDLDAVRDLLRDPRFRASSPVFYTIQGRRR
jgi:SAM-dependent methyltransferase